MLVFNICIGTITTPVGVILFTGCIVVGISIEGVIKILILYFIVISIVLLLVTYVPAISKSIYNLYQPDKINYVTFGGKVPHVHIVPKYENQIRWGEACHDDVEKVLLTEEKYDELVKDILNELEKYV